LSDIFYLNEDNWVCSLTLGNLFKLTKFAYFLGQKPSGIIESLLFAVAACTDYVGLPDLTSRVRTFRFRLASGRLLGFQKDNQILILDYAHEIESLNFLLNDFSYKFPNVRPWLITRVAPDRRDQYIQEYGQNIAKLNQIQKLIVYDKLTSKEFLINILGVNAIRTKLVNCFLIQLNNRILILWLNFPKTLR